MRTRISCPNVRRLRSGLTLLEITIALIITTIIMVALAQAFAVAGKNWTSNRDELASLHAARLAMFRICQDVRQATDGDVGFPMPAVPTCSAPGSTLTLITSDINVWHVYLLSGKELRYYDNVPAGTASLTGLRSTRLANNVSSLSFTAESDVANQLVNVQIRMTITTGNQSFTIPDSAVVRKNRQLPTPGTTQPSQTSPPL